ncbi:MAG: IPTL-CTERM sorting domain-containing protein [Lysobacterales bacterium]|jgi:hypothetical protein
MSLATRFSPRCVSFLSGLMALAAVAAVQAAIPLEGVFVENLGQWPDQARYHMLVGETGDDQARRVDVWLTPSGYVYQTTEQTDDPESARRQHVVSVDLVGASAGEATGREPMPGVFNWLRGGEENSVHGARSYRQVRYAQVYPGIDLLFDSANEARMLETTFVVAPGADPGPILLRYEGADAAAIDADGNLSLSTTLGDITELSPIAFQLSDNGSREPIQVSFRLEADELAFDIGAYDASRTLYIDPIVTFSRAFGGSSGDYVSEMHEDPSGRYVTGYTFSSDFPVTAGAHDETYNGLDLFAAKFDSANENLLWATFIGGTGSEYGGNSALAADGTLYLVASTNSGGSWPANYTWGAGGSYDVGVFHLSADGASQMGGILLGGTGSDYGADVEIDGGGNVVFSGMAGNDTFPTGPGGGFDETNDGNDAFVTRFDDVLTAWLDFSYVPGSTSADGAGGHAFDAAGNVYVYGFTVGAEAYPATDVIGPGGNYDLFVAKFNTDLSALDYNTRIGGNSTDPTPGYSYTAAQYYTIANSALVVDSSNRAWVTGGAASTDFPTTPGAFRTTNAGNYDVFVLALNAAGDGLEVSTFLGGSSTDVGKALAFDADGNVYVVGTSASGNFPILGSPQEHGGGYDMFLTVFSPTLSEVLTSSLWGGTSSEYATDLVLGSGGRVRMAGFSLAAATFQVPAEAPLFGPGGNFDGVVVEFSGVQAAEGVAQFHVTKTFSDGSDDEVDVTLTCNTGLPLEQTFTVTGGDPKGVNFIVHDIPEGGANCEITESGGPDGYTPAFNGGNGCAWTDVTAGLRACEITNSADPATFTVNKEWVIENGSASDLNEAAYITVYCNNEIQNGNWNGNEWYYGAWLDGNDSLEVTVDTTQQSAQCYAMEDIDQQTGIEFDTNCDTQVIVAGGSASCEFINTVFFEGIPTLSQWSLAILAVLTLGIGLVAFRRFT